MTTPVEGRTCGECTECCKLMAVKELNKPIYKRCEHVKMGVGCGIYSERPQSCRYFRCLWLVGSMAESDRPDRLRVMFVPSPDQAKVIAYESFPGAAQGKRAQQVIETYRKNLDVLLVDGQRMTRMTIDGIPIVDELPRHDWTTRI